MNAAFRDELVRLIPKLRAYALVLCRSASEADDIVQETLVRAWRFGDSFRDGSNMTAWTFTILRNTFLSSRVRKHMQYQFDDAIGPVHAGSQTPDQEWRLRYKELLAGLGQLPEAQRQAILLVGGAGLTYDEAARVCGCSVGTVKSRVSRARVCLAELLDSGVLHWSRPRHDGAHPAHHAA